jgi:flagellar biosynthesis anti-sigma factor FlgM
LQEGIQVEERNMRIDLNNADLSNAAGQLSESGRAGAQGPAGSAAAGGVSAQDTGQITTQDRAQLSGASAQIQSLAAQASQLPEIRQERVSALRQVVGSGNYHPSAEDVAGAIITQLVVEPAA